MVEIEEREIENSVRVREALSQTKLERRAGEVKALECRWSSPASLLHDNRRMDAGLGEEIDLEGEHERLHHQHHVHDTDGEQYWDEILAYLHLGWLPHTKFEAEKIMRHSKRFFILHDVLWHKNGSKPPLLVILNEGVQLRIAQDAHDDIGHCGWDPTFQRVRDSYWWPNQYVFIATYCRSCHECQMRSTYHNTIPLQPQYVRTILRCFDADSVHMPAGSGGQKYIVDLVDNLMGWVEARALRKLRALSIADFLFEVMCRFGCIFQLTCDNGSEFKGAVENLMYKYKVPVVRISPYNSQANGKIERTQRTYLEAIWKVLQGETNQWPSKLGYALWADRITVKRNTGYSPYYLLYGQHLLLPFDVVDRTFHVLEWQTVTNTAELLALRIQQLDQRNSLLVEAREKNFQSRAKAIDAYHQRHADRMKQGEYAIGELVLVYNEALENRMNSKGALRWRGPYAVVARRPTGAYVVQELDGSILKQPVAWK